MNALVQCPDCSHEVSTAAEACPQCGRPLRKRQTATGMLAAMVLPFFIVVVALVVMGGGLFLFTLLR